jgi:hypothetical protein
MNAVVPSIPVGGEGHPLIPGQKSITNVGQSRRFNRISCAGGNSRPVLLALEREDEIT